LEGAAGAVGGFEGEIPRHVGPREREGPRGSGAERGMLAGRVGLGLAGDGAGSRVRPGKE
jgi:hypothetical protein